MLADGLGAAYYEPCSKVVAFNPEYKLELPGCLKIQSIYAY